MVACSGLEFVSERDSHFVLELYCESLRGCLIKYERLVKICRSKEATAKARLHVNLTRVSCTKV
jgi:hypothetical protein